MITEKNLILIDNTSLESARMTLKKLEKGVAISDIKNKEFSNIERITDALVLTDGLIVDSEALANSKAANQLLEVSQNLIKPIETNGSEREDLYISALAYKEILQDKLEPVSSLADYMKLVKSGGYWDTQLDLHYPKSSKNTIDEKKYMWDRMCVRMGFMWALSNKLKVSMLPHHTRSEMIIGLYNSANKIQKCNLESPLHQATNILKMSDDRIGSELDSNSWITPTFELKRPNMFEWLWDKSNKSTQGFFEEVQLLANTKDIKKFRQFSLELFNAQRNCDSEKILKLSGELDENLEKISKGEKYKSNKLSVTTVIPIPFIKIKTESGRVSEFLSSYTNPEFAFISKWAHRRNI